MTQEPQLNYHPGSERLFLEYPFKAGSAPRVDEYVDVRAGISWPTSSVPGYFCIIGLQKMPDNKMAQVLLSEGESVDMDSFFALYADHTKKTYCPRTFARTEDNRGASFDKSLRQYRIDKDLDCPLPADSSKFDDPVYGVKLIERLVKEKLLAIAEPPTPSYCSGILIDQLRSIKDDSATDNFEERLYAVAALIRVLGSLEKWPYRNARYGDFEFTNFQHRTRPKGSGGFQEVYAD